MKKLYLTLILLITANVAYAQTIASEDSLKAAFIYHFITFTEWDDKLDSYFVCIPDDDNLRKVASEALKGKTVNGRMIFVMQHAPICHVLVSNSQPAGLSELAIGSLQNGSLMEFRNVNNKLRFAVDVGRIRRSKLKISSQLLKLAILEDAS